VLVDDVLVCDNDPARQNDTGDLILTANDNVKEDHPVSHALASNKIAVRFGAARTARPDPARGANPGLVVTPIVGTGSNAWGERDYNRAGAPVFDRRVDLPGPFAVATASERVPSGGLKPVPSGRLVVFGGADWAANSRLTTPGNLTLFLAAVNWTVDRGAGLALGDVPARPIERIQLTLDSQQLQRLRYALVFALPGAAALLGLAVFWARRR
jgi:hypothetical protein